MKVICRSSVLMAIALAAGAGAVFGQAATSSPAAGSAAEKVQVAESVEARESLDRIATLESQGRYVQASWDYQRLLADHGDAVVRMPDGTYVGVAPLVLLRIESWPLDARTISRDLLEPRAAAAMNEIDESADPSRVMLKAQKWWLTRPAGEAALRSAKRMAGAGYIGSAEWILGRLAKGHPELAGEIRQLKQVCADRTHADGSTSQSTQAASRPGAQPGPTQVVLWAVDSEEAESETAPANGVHSAASEAVTDGPSTPSIPAESDRLEAGPTRTELTGIRGETLSRPVMLGDHVFVQDTSQLYCLRMYSGYIEWSAGRRVAGAMAFEPTAGEGCVFAALPHAVHVAATTQPVDVERVLMGLVASDGTIAWTVRPRQLVEMEGESGTYLRSSPVWYEGGLYVTAGTRTGAIEDIYLLRVDPGTGAVIWRRHLASWTSAEAEPLGATCELLADRGVIRVYAPGGLEAIVAALTGDVERIAIARNVAGRRSMRANTGYAVEAGGVLVRVSRRGTQSPPAISAAVRGGDAATVLDSRINAEPQDCGRRLDLARWAIRQKETADRAIAAMKEAVACEERTRPPKEKTTPVTSETLPGQQRWKPVRRQVLELALEHANDAALTDELLAVGSTASESPEEKARCRLRFSAARERQGRWPAAIELLQEILENDAVRGQRVDGRSAGTIAAEKIGEIVRKQGRSTYEAVEGRAERLAAEGRSDSSRLEAVLLRFPNSRAAAKARLDLVRIARQSDQPRRAIRWLKEGTAYSDLEDRSAIVAQVAECYFEMGDPTRGLATLASGANEFADQPITFAGMKTTFGEVRKAWQANAETISRPLPKLSEPIGAGFGQTFEQPFVLLAAPDADDGPVVRRFDLVLAQSRGAILGIDAMSGKTRWRTAWQAQHAPIWLTDDDDVLVLSAPTQLLALDRVTGAERWRWALLNEGRNNDALIDPEFLDTITARAASDTMVVVSSRSGRVCAMRLSDGQRLWQRQVAGASIDAIGFGVSEMICLRTVEGRVEGIALHAQDGRELARSVLSHSGRPLSPVLAADGTVVIADGQEVVGYEPRTLNQLWRWQVAKNKTATGLRAIAGELYVYGSGFVASLAPDGRPRWESTGFGAGTSAVRSVRGTGGQLYIAGDDFLGGADAATGKVRREITLTKGEAIEDWTLTPRYVAAVISRPATGETAGPRVLEAVFMPRTAEETGYPTGLPRILLNDSIAVRKLVLCDGAVVAQTGEKLVSWRSLAGANPPPTSR